MVDKLINVSEMEKRARRRLPRMVFDYIQGGAESESTLKANVEGFANIRLRPRLLVDVSTRRLSTNVLGEDLSVPVMLGPVGLAGITRSHGERDAAVASMKMGTVSTVSTASSDSLEFISDSLTKPQWFQLYPWGERDAVERLIKRAKNAGYSTMVVTADVPITGNRERDRLNGMTIPPRPSIRNFINLLRHPRWLSRFFFGAPINFANIAEESESAGVSSLAKRHEGLLNPGHVWTDLQWIRDLWPGKVVLKGVTHPEDAEFAAKTGCDGVIVSNHGGRQLDYMPSSIQRLPSIVDAAGDDLEVLMDGGIRRGTDIVKALALGAKAVMVGRPWVYGLALKGESGVMQCLEILREETDRTLALMGKRDVSELSKADLEFV